MQIEAERFIRHIRACDNAVLPGDRVQLSIGPTAVGWTMPHHAPTARLADAAAFGAYVDGLAAEGAFRPRNELFDVRADDGGEVVTTADRGAVPLLGIAARGVHVNGLVRRSDGWHLWVARRAPGKRMDPDKLDHLTAGGIAAGHDAWHTLIKEAGEEASIPPDLARQASEVGTITYAMQREEGLRRDRLYCFDLEMPEQFTPAPNDDEVAGFTLCPLDQVMRQVAETDDFKFNVNLVLIDLFIRKGLIAAAGPVAAAMAALSSMPSSRGATGRLRRSGAARR